MSSTGEQAVAEQIQDAPQPQSRKSGGGSRGEGARGGKGRSGSGQSRDVQVSKALSKLLRHDAVKAGLELDDEGYAGVGEVVSLRFLFFCVCQGGRGEVEKQSGHVMDILKLLMAYIYSRRPVDGHGEI